MAKTKSFKLPQKKSVKGSQRTFAAPFALTGTNVNTELVKVQTVITNTSTKDLTLSFLGVHGKVLDAGATHTVDGDLTSSLLTGGGRKHQRYLDALDNLIENKLITIYRNVLHIRYFPVDSATVIAAGDLVYLDTDDIKPAADIAWNSNLATTQADLANVFMGVAMEAKAAGSASTNFPVQVGPFALHRFTAASSTYLPGDLVGADKASGNALLSNTVELAVAASSIGRVASRHSSASTSVLINIQSAYWGHNAAAAQ